MPLLVVSGPTTEPVTLEEAKAHLRVDGNDEDAYIEALISRARVICEAFQGRAYGRRTLELSLHAWPERREIRLPRPPLVSVESITYITRGGEQHTLAPEAYLVDTRSTPGRIVLREGYSWPSEPLQEANGVVIRYEAGYDEVPDHLRTIEAAILLTVGHLYENRGDVAPSGASAAAAPKLPKAAQDLLWPYRVFGEVDVE